MKKKIKQLLIGDGEGNLSLYDFTVNKIEFVDKVPDDIEEKTLYAEYYNHDENESDDNIYDDPLLLNYVKVLDVNIFNIWVSNQGEDLTADGSKTHPFKTLQAAIDYSVRFKSYGTIQISFLTDYEQTEDVVNIQIGMGNPFLRIDGGTKTVKLNNIYSIYSMFNLSNVTLVKKKNTDMINISADTRITSSNINVEIKDPSFTEAFLTLRYNSSWDFLRGLHIDVNSENSLLFRIYEKANLTVRNLKDVNVSGVVAKDNSIKGKLKNFIEIFNHSTATIQNEFKGSFVGKKYDANRNATISFNKKGDQLIPGSIAGTVDDTSKIC